MAPVYFGSDESGDFNMSRGWSESCSVWVTVACPNGHRGRVERWVKERRHEWGVREFHAAGRGPSKGLTRDQRAEVCAYVGTGDLLWVATIIDSAMLSARDVVERQTRQLEQFEFDWARSKRGTSVDAEDVAFGALVRSLLDPADGAKAAPFTQYGIAAPGHVHETVRSVLSAYSAPEWRDDFTALHMAFDRKNEPARSKDTPGEVLFSNVVMPILANQTLTLPLGFQDPSHPLRAGHPGSSKGSIDIKSLLGGGVTFVDSADDVLVQIADVLAYVMRRASIRPDDTSATRDYANARRRLYGRTPVMFSTGDFAALRRYAHVLR